MKYLLFSALITAQSALASTICTPTESKGEGHWPIEEKVFSKSNAEASILSLGKLMLESEEKDEYFAENYAISWSEAVANEMVIVKGFTLKKLAEKEKSELAINNFCEFLEKEAFVSH